MNKILCIDTNYLRPNLTIETIEIDFGKQKYISYIYNYEGLHFRFFENIERLIAFFAKGEEPKNQFGKERDCDNFLEKITEKELFYLKI